MPGDPQAKSNPHGRFGSFGLQVELDATTEAIALRVTKRSYLLRLVEHLPKFGEDFLRSLWRFTGSSLEFPCFDCVQRLVDCVRQQGYFVWREGNSNLVLCDVRRFHRSPRSSNTSREVIGPALAREEDDDAKGSSAQVIDRLGAGGGNRTHTDLLGPSDFKSDASASSATPAHPDSGRILGP